MRIFFILFFFCTSFISSAQYMWQINKDTIVKWYYQDGDEFNADQLDRNRWETGLSWGRAVFNQNVYFTDGQNLSEGNGTLALSLNKEDYIGHVNSWEIDSNYLKKNNIKLVDNNYTFKYTAGLIFSKQKYKYGYFEIRFKCPKNGRGIWPAFWTFGGNKNDEIDFFELKCEKNNYIHVDVHCPDGCRNYPTALGLHKDWGAWVKDEGYFDDGYNTVAGEWGKGYVKWYLNGKGIAYFKGNFETAMNLIANMSQAIDNGAFSPGPDATTVYPSVMNIDYIRVWSKDEQAQLTSPFMKEENINLKNRSVDLSSNDVKLKRPQKLSYGKKKNYKNDGINLSLLQENRNTWLVTIRGNDVTPVSIDISDTSGKSLFKKDDQVSEFLRIELENLSPGSYTFTAKYKEKTVKQDIIVLGRK